MCHHVGVGMASRNKYTARENPIAARTSKQTKITTTSATTFS